MSQKFHQDEKNPGSSMTSYPPITYPEVKDDTERKPLLSSESASTGRDPNDLTPSSSEDSKEWILYTRRWYLLFVFVILSTQQSILWITFSPVGETAEKYFNTDDFVIDLLLAWGAIIYIPFMFFSGYIMNLKGGLRRIIILGAILDGLGGAVRCLAIINPKAWWALPIVSLGQILNAAVGPLVMASPSKLSATWFGEKERTTVTAIATLANVLGSALGFLYGPYVVQFYDIQTLIVVQAIQSVIVMVLVLVYFPEKPPTPPSASASINIDNKDNSTPNSKTQNFYSELLQLSKDGPFMLLSTIGGFALGAFGAWTGMFNLILAPVGYSETFSGWLGFVTNMAGIVGGVVLGILGDTIFARRFKISLTILFFLSSVLFLYFSLSLPSGFSPHALVPNNTYGIVIFITLGGLMIGSTNPIFLEFGAEITFPISEGSSAGMFTLLQNIGNLVVLLVTPKIPYKFVNFGMAVMMWISGVAMLFVREVYLRKDFDELATQKAKSRHLNQSEFFS